MQLDEKFDLLILITLHQTTLSYFLVSSTLEMTLVRILTGTYKTYFQPFMKHEPRPSLCSYPK